MRREGWACFEAVRCREVELPWGPECRDREGRAWGGLNRGSGLSWCSSVASVIDGRRGGLRRLGGNLYRGRLKGVSCFGTVRWPICRCWAVPTGFEGSARVGPDIGVGLPGAAARVRGWR